MVQVISRKDQAQFWDGKGKPYSYISVDHFIEKFKDSHLGRQLDEELSEPFDKSQSHKDALSFNTYSLSKWELFKACTRREFLLMKRNSFIYVFKSVQVASLLIFFFLSDSLSIWSTTFRGIFVFFHPAAGHHCFNNNDGFPPNSNGY